MGIFDTTGGALDPATAGLLSAAFGALQNSGPSLMPRTLGQTIGAGGQAGLQGYQQASQLKMQQALQQQQLIGQIINNRLQGGKADFFEGVGQPSGAPSPAGPTPPGLSTSSSQAMFGTPEYGSVTPPAAPSATQSGGGGFPLVPGLDPSLSRAAAMGWLAPNYVSAVASAHEPAVTRYGIYDKTTGKLIGGALPPNMAPIQMVNGQPTVAAYPGQMDFLGEASSREAQGKAQFASKTVTFNGKQYEVPGTVIAKGPQAIADYLGGQVSGSPAPTGRPAGFPFETRGEATEANQRSLGVIAQEKSDLIAQGKEVPDSLERELSRAQWGTVPKLTPPTGLGQTKYQEGLQAQQAEAAGRVGKEQSDLATQANDRMSRNNQALDLVDKADVGPGSDYLTGLKKWAVQFGWAKESDFEKSPAANIALNKDLVNSALSVGRQLFGSRFTQSEVGIMLNRASPSAEQTRAAIKFLLNTDNAKLQYQINQASNFSKYQDKGGDPIQYGAWYAKTFPMTDEISKVKLDLSPEFKGKQTPLVSDADLRYTALKNGISVDEVKKRLGIR